MTHCSVFEVKRCGFCMVYKKDIEDVNRSMAQCSNNSTIPYKGLDVLHHKFSYAKQTRDDHDGVGPNGEGSSNDVPHPKWNVTKTDCEESIEYRECGEELSNWKESSESDQEG